MKKNNQQKHPALLTFQALRIEVNKELSNLEKALTDIIPFLSPTARIVVISYHSLEDRIVKNVFRQESKNCLCPPHLPICQCHHQAQLKVITKKPISPNEIEIQNNSRSRSAKLRTAEKI